jgi:acetate kinase
VNVLCVNAGSSTLKLAVFDGERRVSQAQVRGNGERELEEALAQLGNFSPDAVGHRLVHGGPIFHHPARIDAALMASLRGIIRFAPLHLPPALDAVEAIASRFPRVPQVACFDTHFHWNLPERARRLPLPLSLHEEGVRRYGFHGLSYEYIVSEMGSRLGRRAVLAHLGNGASLAALDEGSCVDTTMAFTPASGIVMSTRPGDLDPGVILYLMGKGAAAPDIQQLIDRECGMLAISGVSSDMRTLLERRKSDARAALAVEMFEYSCRKAIGALAAVLGGLDTLVLTGGIGENSPEVRAGICAGLGHLGLRMDDEANRAGRTTISTAGSPCAVYVVRTDEDRIIARHAHEVLRG